MTTETQTDLQRAAHDALVWFHYTGQAGTGHDGREVRPNIWTTRGENTPEWVRDLCHDAHGDMMPDDVRYGMIPDALSALEEYGDEDEARDSIEAPIYTSKLTDWLGSRADRTSYVDEARQEFEPSDMGIVGDLMRGWLMEAWEVFDSVQGSLEDRAESEAEDD